MAVKINIIETEQRLTVKESRRLGIQNFDIDNLYPQRQRQAAGSSGRTSTCLDVLARFIMGGGLKDKRLYRMQVNDDGLRLDELHRKITGRDGFALHRYFGIHIQYNALGEIIGLTPLHSEELRRGLRDPKTGKVFHIKHNPDWGGELDKFSEDNTTTCNVFNPDPDTVLNEIFEAGGIEYYKGQIFFYSAAGNKYPLSVIDPVLEDVHSDKEKKLHNYANLTTNFLASQMLVTDKFTNETDRTKFKDGLKKFQGARNAGKILHVEKTATDQTIDLKKVDIQDQDKLFIATTADVKDAIRSVFIIPPILIGDREPGKLGPSQQEIQDAVTFFNWITADLRLVFEETYSKIFRHWHDKKLVEGADFSILEVSAEVGNKNQPLAVSLGVGGTQSAMSIVVDPVLSPQQKINTLVIMFGLSLQQASSMVLGTQITDSI